MSVRKFDILYTHAYLYVVVGVESEVLNMYIPNPIMATRPASQYHAMPKKEGVSGVGGAK